MGEPLDNGGFPHARLADQYRIVFCFARENPNDGADFAVAPDDRIELSGAGEFDQILPIFGQSIIGAFRIVGGDPLIAANGFECV